MTTTIYVKTAKGIDEIKNRTHGLPPRARQALILFDGKRTADDVADMLPDGESETLALPDDLAAGGYIESQQQTSVVKSRIIATSKPVPKTVAATTRCQSRAPATAMPRTS
jgi:hypothetical protein